MPIARLHSLCQEYFIAASNALYIFYFATEKTCGLPADPGTSFGYFESWFYDAERKECTKFIYGGDGGNDNRFDSAAICQRLCGNYKGILRK